MIFVYRKYYRRTLEEEFRALGICHEIQEEGDEVIYAEALCDCKVYLVWVCPDNAQRNDLISFRQSIINNPNLPHFITVYDDLDDLIYNLTKDIPYIAIEG